MLADLTGKSMSTQLHDIYFKALEPLGIDKVNMVLLHYVEEAKFPSVADIRSKLGVCSQETDDNEKARLLTQKVVEGIVKFGWPNQIEAEKWFGPDNWEIITRYLPWSQICDIDNDQLPSFNAQFREFAKAYLHNKKYQAHLALENRSNSIVTGLLDNKMQKLIDKC
jgi:hypothetical protein